jgi:hypothetical protein
MNMPSKGELVYVEGYGGAIFAGAFALDDPENGAVMLKFEGVGLDEGYGNGIITIPYTEYAENRVHPEQVPDGTPMVRSTEKRDAILRERGGDV